MEENTEIHHWTEIGRTRYNQPVIYDMLSAEGTIITSAQLLTGEPIPSKDSPRAYRDVRYDRSYVKAKLSRSVPELIAICDREEFLNLMSEIWDDRHQQTDG